MATYYILKLKVNKGCATLWPCQIYIKKYRKAKEEELWKLKYFTIAKI
jgi:hypothetical protein